MNPNSPAESPNSRERSPAITAFAERKKYERKYANANAPNTDAALAPKLRIPPRIPEASHTPC